MSTASEVDQHMTCNAESGNFVRRRANDGTFSLMVIGGQTFRSCFLSDFRHLHGKPVTYHVLEGQNVTVKSCTFQYTVGASTGEAINCNDGKQAYSAAALEKERANMHGVCQGVLASFVQKGRVNLGARPQGFGTEEAVRKRLEAHLHDLHAIGIRPKAQP